MNEASKLITSTMAACAIGTLILIITFFVSGIIIGAGLQLLKALPLDINHDHALICGQISVQIIWHFGLFLSVFAVMDYLTSNRLQTAIIFAWPVAAFLFMSTTNWLFGLDFFSRDATLQAILVALFSAAFFTYDRRVHPDLAMSSQ